MGRMLNEATVERAAGRGERVEAGYREATDEVENLRELREIAGKTQYQIANTLKIKQPSVSMIERRPDICLSTLRSFVRAVGGELEIIVRLPSRRPVRVRKYGHVLEKAEKRGRAPEKVVQSRPNRPKSPRRPG